jgi:hypothetical protein
MMHAQGRLACERNFVLLLASKEGGESTQDDASDKLSLGEDPAHKVGNDISTAPVA